MGTISDKLMRIINTKEDIRRALISKGYDVPTSIPFKEYAKMILDLPCNADSFPDIEGIVARYSALGLTNEQMAENPVWKDLTGNGHDLQMKNFAWKGMSGVGGYKFDFLLNEWATSNDQISEKYSYKIVINNKQNGVQLINNSRHIKITLKITGIEINKSIFRVYDNAGMEHKQDYTKDGIYEIDYTANEGANRIYFYVVGGNMGQLENPITIEQLPLYPGALVFDGVDDYGVCENFPILTKEKGYTVVALRQWLSFQDIGYPTLVVNSTDRLAAFSFEDFRNETKSTWNWGRSVGLSDYKIPLLYTYQTSTSYNSKTIYAGATEEGSNILQVCRSGFYCANAAIWEIVILDHDATEEELTKIKDYFVKTYPWLFPDQAWTVVGKTNEDEDRATIANITGNGNDLVLSNFGFAEGSGYGLYAYNFNSFNLRDNVVKPTDVKKDSFRIIGTGNSSNLLILTNESDSANWKIRITGMKDGDYLLVGNANKRDDYVKITKDGVYTFQKQYVATSTNGIWYNSSQEVDVLVEQIPEYEGYLITDGVDDEIISAKLIQFADKFTIVGDWKFMEDRNDNAGLLKANQIYIYNATTGMRIYLKQGSKNYPFSCKKINALTSDGWVYDEKWDKYKVYPIGSDIDISSRLFLGFYSSNFTKIALKNLGIYNNQILSKDDCIKAYNYLQTLKAK
jgi:hypothetical protein